MKSQKKIYEIDIKKYVPYRTVPYLYPNVVFVTLNLA